MRMDNREVFDLADLRRLMVSHKIGDTVPLVVVGPGGGRRSVTVTLAERPNPI